MESVRVIRGVRDAWVEKHPEHQSRIEKAIAIALFRTVDRQPDGTWQVQSETDPSVFYQVSGDLRVCSCPDALRRPEYVCKHRLAVKFIAKVEWVERQEQNAAQVDAFRLVGLVGTPS